MIEEHRDVMMENYQEKYKKELHQQEINSNIHTLKGFFWIFVTILLLWPADRHSGCPSWRAADRGYC